MAKNKAAVLSVLNVTWRLLVICLAVAALVALVFEVTKGPIAKDELARKENAVRAIFPETATMAEGQTVVDDDRVNAVYDVKNAQGTFIGWCVDFVGTSDYGGDVGMMVGVAPDGKVIGVQVINHSETFIDRYTDDTGMYTGIDQPYGADVSAGATMSYNALRNAITDVEELFADLAKAPIADGGNNADPDDGEEPAPQSAFTEADVTLFFDNVSTFYEPGIAVFSPVKAVCTVKDETGTLLGHCIKITATGGQNGRFDLLMARNASGTVIGVQVLENFEDRMEEYVDQNGVFDLEQDVVISATVTYNAIRAAIATAEGLDLGGAV